MKNCIKTVYPFSIENENAPIFGRLSLHMYDDVTITSNTQLTLIVQGSGVKISVDEPNYFVIGQDTDPSVVKNRHNEYIIPDESIKFLKFAQGNYDIYIDEKYNLVLLGCNAGSGSAECPIGINLDDVAYLTNLKGLRWIYNKNHTIGSINSLGRLIHLGEDYSSTPSSAPNKYYVFAFASNLVTGSIETFVEGQINNGRLVTGDAPIKIFTTSVTDFKVTFGTFTLTSLLGMSFSAYWLTWENASKIAIYKGNAIVSSTSVYVRGYSVSEITTNQGSGGIWEGMTVTDVVSGTVYPPA